MRPRTKLWLEEDGALVLSEYRVRLLRHIDTTGTIAAAADEMGLSYRRAWGKVREIEENLGMKLVERVIGGPGGGGSRLTDDGRALIDRFERYRAAVERRADEEFEIAFGKAGTTH